MRLGRLREVYEIDQSWECAARAYLLHLLGFTIFTNKSANWVSVCYLALFRDLDMCEQWAWGAAILTFMYEQLGYTIFANKSANWVSVYYLTLFRDLDMCGQWAWGDVYE